MRFSFVKEVPGGNIYSIPQISVIPIFPGGRGQIWLMLQRFCKPFLLVVCNQVGGSSVIQCDGVWGREAVTVVIVFLFHGINTPRTHTTGSLAGSWKKSDCPGTEKSGGGDGG